MLPSIVGNRLSISVSDQVQRVMCTMSISFSFGISIWSHLGFKTTRTVVCGPHRTVRTAPALMGQKCPHSHNFRTVHLSPNFEKMLEKKFWKKKFFFQLFFLIFFPIRAQMNCAGAVRVRTTAQLKNTVVVRSAHHTKIHCGLDPYSLYIFFIFQNWWFFNFWKKN